MTVDQQEAKRDLSGDRLRMGYNFGRGLLISANGNQ